MPIPARSLLAAPNAAARAREAMAQEFDNTKKKEEDERDKLKATALAGNPRPAGKGRRKLG